MINAALMEIYEDPLIRAEVRYELRNTQNLLLWIGDNFYDIYHLITGTYETAQRTIEVYYTHDLHFIIHIIKETL